MKALLIIDVQNDFLPGGALAVEEGDKIIPVINRVQYQFEHIVATRDWHPPNHGSFASNHEGARVSDIITLDGLEQILWPDHCVQGSPGAEFPPQLNKTFIERVIFKGDDPLVDSYSAFFDNGHRRDTGLHHFLRKKGVTDVYVTGLAADVCVYYTVKDALTLGYSTWLITDAIRGVNLKSDDTQKAIDDMAARGAHIITSDQI